MSEIVSPKTKDTAAFPSMMESSAPKDKVSMINVTRAGIQLGEAENNGSRTFQGWPDQLSMMKDQLIEMIRGYERAGFEDMK